MQPNFFLCSINNKCKKTSLLGDNESGASDVTYFLGMDHANDLILALGLFLDQNDGRARTLQFERIEVKDLLLLEKSDRDKSDSAKNDENNVGEKQRLNHLRGTFLFGAYELFVTITEFSFLRQQDLSMKKAFQKQMKKLFIGFLVSERRIIDGILKIDPNASFFAYYL